MVSLDLVELVSGLLAVADLVVWIVLMAVVVETHIPNTHDNKTTALMANNQVRFRVILCVSVYVYVGVSMSVYVRVYVYYLSFIATNY